MPKDYKDAPSPRADSRLNHPLLLGIVISLAVALWLNRLSNPFVEKGKAVEPTPKIAPAQPPAPAGAAKAAEEAAKGKTDESKAAKPPPPAKASERPRFEFYQILPGEKEGADKDAKAAAKAPPPAPANAPAAPAKAGSSPANAKPHSGEVYWLQAGAFSDEKEADNLKAKIAFTGLEATVRPVSIPDKGTLYRVRLGPYQSLDDANRIKTALSQNGVGAAIIRTNDEAKNP
ncbi:MAG: SPOR domain-containing protein [Usitatibacter sp.]